MVYRGVVSCISINALAFASGMVVDSCAGATWVCWCWHWRIGRTAVVVAIEAAISGGLGGGIVLVGVLATVSDAGV